MNEEPKIPEKIAGAGKQLPFGIPDRYFEEFGSRLQDRIHAAEPSKTGTGLIRMMRPAMGYAALVAGFLIIVFFAVRQMSGSGQKDFPDAPELAEMVDYFMVDFDEEMLYETLSDLQDTQEVTPLADQSDEIFDYLSVDGVDDVLLIDDNQ